MKRGTPDHPKTEMLAELLGVCVAQAVGHMEMLWHFAAKHSPAGDIGRWPDSMIAKRAGWNGDPQQFVGALEAAKGAGRHGWIEKHRSHRLVLHDWHEHAEESVKKWLANHDEKFWNGIKPFARRVQKQISEVANDSRHDLDTVANDSRNDLDEVEIVSSQPSLAKPSQAKPGLARPKEKSSLRERKPARITLSDSDFLDALKSNPAYCHVDLTAELGKMDAWLAVNPGRQKTHRFVVNWLNRIGRPLGPSTSGGVHQPTHAAEKTTAASRRMFDRAAAEESELERQKREACA